MSDVAELAPRPISLNPGQIARHGVQVLRAIELGQQITDIQSELVDTFGPTIRAFAFEDHDPYLPVVTRGESARALVGTRDLRGGVAGAPALATRLESELPAHVYPHIWSRASGELDLRVQRLANGNKHTVIGIVLAHPALKHHRERVTDQIDDFIGARYDWRNYVPVVAVASTRNSKLYDRIRDHVLETEVRLNLGGLTVDHKSRPKT